MLWITLLSTIALGWTTPIPLLEDSEEIDEPCFEPCHCEVRESLFHIHCDGRGFTNVSQVSQSWTRPFKLYLQRNSMRKLYFNSFLHLNSAVAINLGNNALLDVQAGAFNGLGRLKRLYLHENKLEVFRNDTFSGLEGLEYLQADYNVIRRIESGAFRSLHKLRVLILNDNLIPALPSFLFRAVSLTHLDLRGNRLKLLAYRGTLEYVGRGLMEIQLEENPWNCACDIVQLKAWLERVPYTALVGEITCEYPFHLHGKDLREIGRAELCPQLSAEEVEASLGIPRLHAGKDRTWPTKPSSMLSSNHNTASSVENKERHLKPTRRPRPPKASPTPRSAYPGPNQPPIAGYQTRPPIPIICPTECACSLHINDLGLTVNCKEKGFRNISELLPRPLNAKKLYLSGNLIQKIYRSDFWNFSSLDLLHLGSNRISYVQEGAFVNLPNLRSLYLNGNDIERLTPGMFRGLQSLRYLYFEYNVIREIQPATFGLMPVLQLVFLNNNLLRTLPVGAFSGTQLARLNLRNNYFLHLPVSGVLEHLQAVVQIDLHQNPWDCSCDIVPLKQWLEKLSSVIVVGEVVCRTPESAAGKDLRSLDLALLCPELKRSAPPSDNTAAAAPPDGVVAPGNAGSSGFAPARGVIPLSVLILSLLVLVVSAVFAAAALFAHVLKRREKLPFRKRGEAELEGIHMECGIFEGGGREPLEGSPEKPPGHVYDYVPHPVAHMCSNPIYKVRDADMEQQAQQQRQQQQEQEQPLQKPFPETKESGGGSYRTLREKEKEWTMAVTNSQLNTIVAISPGGGVVGFHENGLLCPTVIDSQGPTPTLGYVESLYTVPRLKDLHVAYPHHQGAHYSEAQQDARLKQQTILFAPEAGLGAGPGAGKGFSDQSQSEYLDLRAQLQTKPDYLEVLEKSYRF
ncbi:SLIT and NTRK-like protein 3 isoform X3 [Anguilla anguilla]|uniref:SLIT and NTRK-like protein 3 isoform X3 n=1 Tax=Anguilla anguilla TaxID=7936 RepID=UPI0015AB700B|nr:SLIT and NTRK-like protein 3 isoform X3 [Anguilla anguilla]